MRVTKTIKDYIYEKVEAAYAAKFAALPKLDADFEDKLHECKEDLMAAREEWEMKARKICASYGFEVDTDWRNHPCNIVNISYGYGYNVRQSIAKAEADLHEEVRKAAQDIIVELELGGDRAKLDAMLTALAERVS